MDMHTHSHEHDHHHEVNLDEKYVFSGKAKKTLFTVLGLGILFTIIGVVMLLTGGHHEEGHALLNTVQDQASVNILPSPEAGAEAAGGAEHHGPTWVTRIFANLWINNVFFTGIAVMALFFIAVQYVATAGWSAGLKRIPEAFTGFLPVSLVLMLVVFFIAGHDLFHWTHHDLYDEKSPLFDKIINGKKGFFFWPLSDHPSFPVFYITRMVIFLLVWNIFAFFMKKFSAAEDALGGTGFYRKSVKLSAGFIVFFGVSSSISAWDWVMSIDTHWFSTMFGWYVFASWWVSALAAITLVVVLLKEAGYLKFIGESHLHDLGKFVFAFSIFWTYIWFSQFLLIYYANIPEEIIYFLERLESDYYSKFIFANLFMNFFFPFLALMTRDAKRKITILKIVCTVVLVGHWFDFYLMITPGTVKQSGGFHFLEIGIAMIYFVAFVYLLLHNLAKKPLVAKNHPMLQESLHHHI